MDSESISEAPLSSVQVLPVRVQQPFSASSEGNKRRDLSDEQRMARLSRDQISRIIAGFEENNNPKLTEERAAYRDIAVKYLHSVSTPDFPQSFVEYMDREESFLQAVERVQPKSEIPTYMQRRILSSELAVLYRLLVNRQLYLVYGDYVTRRQQRGLSVPQTDEEVIATKLDLVEEILRATQQKNKEAMLEGTHGEITFGFEVEYSDPVYRTVMDALWGTLETKKRIKDRFPWVSELTTDDWVDIESEQHVAGAFQKLGALYLKGEVGHTREIVTEHTQSPLSQLRELLFMRIAGIMRGGWVVHETIGGIDLTPDHTEIMDVTAMSFAAGFLPVKSKRDSKGNVLENAWTENFKKQSKVGGEGYYFPFHRRRETKGPPAVERRSLPRFEERNFPLLVRDATFSYLAAWGIQAVQKPEAQRTEKDRVLGEAWNILVRNWEVVLRENGIANPSNQERHGVQNISVVRNEQHVIQVPYERFIGKLVKQSQTNPVFVNRTREIIRDYTRRVNQVINY